VSMRNTNGKRGEEPARGRPADGPVALLAAVGLRAEKVERCPDPTCPLCSGGRRAA
jgi:hypothetical protein